MLRINKIELKLFPFHIFLLPAFFVLNKYVQYQGLPETRTSIFVGLQIAVGILACWGLLYFFQRNGTKSAVITFFCALLFLFFGDIRSFFQGVPVLNLISQYKFFLPLLAIFLFLFIKILKKDTVLRRTNLFLTFLLLIYTGIETIRIFQLKNQLKIVPTVLNIDLPDSIKKNMPDIYYLVPDCYPSSSYQKEMLETDNQSFDDSLAALGFNVVMQSKSNYNRTAFSMLSTFNMSYTTITDSSLVPSAREYMLALKEISNANLFQYLDKGGYNFVNLSIFDLAGKKALRKQNFLSTPAKEMFLSQTFWNYFSRDIYYRWFVKKENKEKLNRKTQEPLNQYNHQLIDTLLFTDFSLGKSPVFVYAHLNLPHFPYFYNEHGKPNSPDSIYNADMIVNKKRFAGYIKYTNKQLLRIINSIKTKTNNKAVIIIQSDHGIADFNRSKKADAFRNYSAFYFPDGDYSMIYDSSSNVNCFRIILNKYMKQTLPLLPDKTFYIRIK